MTLARPASLPRVASGPAFSTRKAAPADDWSDIEALLQSPPEVRVEERRQGSGGRARTALSSAGLRRGIVTFIGLPAAISFVFAATLTCAFWSSAECNSRFGCVRSAPTGVPNGQVAVSDPKTYSQAVAAPPIIEGRSSSETRTAAGLVNASAAPVGGLPYGSFRAVDMGLSAVQDLDLRLRRLQTAHDRQAADIELMKQRLEALAGRLH